MFNLVLWAALVPALAEPAAPAGVPPTQMLAVIDNAGQLRLVWVSPSPCEMPDQEHSIPVAPAPNAPNKAPERAKVKITTLVVTTVELAATHAQGYTTDGRGIAADRLTNLLAKERPVLVAMDGKKVDPFLLQLYKEDTVVLVLPANTIPAGPVAPYAVPVGGAVLPFGGPAVVPLPPNPAPQPVAPPRP